MIYLLLFENPKIPFCRIHGFSNATLFIIQPAHVVKTFVHHSSSFSYKNLPQKLTRYMNINMRLFLIPLSPYPHSYQESLKKQPSSLPITYPSPLLSPQTESSHPLHQQIKIFHILPAQPVTTLPVTNM